MLQFRRSLANHVLPGLVFVRNETIDFEGDEQVYFSPFEAFIQAALTNGLPYRFVLPVTNKRARFADPQIEAVVDKVGSARGLFRGLARTAEIIATLRRIRRETGISTVVIRVPEHTNLLLLPLLTLFRFEIVIWLVHDRLKVTRSDKEHRARLRSQIAGLISLVTGAVEARYLNKCRVVSNGRELAERYCGDNPLVKVVYSTLVTEAERQELEAFGKTYRREPNRLRLVYAGRLSVEKGIDRLLDLVEALNALGRPDGISCSCQIIGKVDETMRAYIEERLRKSPYSSSIEVAGFVRRGADLWTAFAASDFFCLLSSAEGTPRVIPEAFACGLPVIASKDANANRIVEETNLVLTSAGPTDLAGRVMALYKDELAYLQTRFSVSQRSRTYTIETLLDQFSTGVNLGADLSTRRDRSP